MKIITNVFGPDVTLKRELFLDLVSPTLKEVLQELKGRHQGGWDRLVNDNLSLREGCVILVNGRNIWSLDQYETRIQDGDEITFTVLVAGG